MAHQLTSTDSGFSNKRSEASKEKFLGRMERQIPWQRLVSVIEPYYLKEGNGRPYPLMTMLRMHCTQQWYSLSGPAMEDTLYEIVSIRLFAGLSLDRPIPDHTTIMNFRHLLERYNLACTIFDEVVNWLSDAGVLIKEGSLIDATIIEAPNSTKNKAGARDPEMHHTKKCHQWPLGGVDARTGITHSLTTTAANVHDLNQAEHLLHEEEAFVFADSGYRGAEKRAELKDVKADWYIAAIPSKVKVLKSIRASIKCYWILSIRRRAFGQKLNILS